MKPPCATQVPGVAAALAQLRSRPPKEASETAKDAQARIQRDFSSNAVAANMDALIKAAVQAHSEGKPPKSERRLTLVTDDVPPPVDWNTPWTLLAHPDVAVDADKIEAVILQNPTLATAQVAVVPYVDAAGKPGAFMLPKSGTPHPYLPVLVRTHMFGHAQASFVTRHAIAALVLSNVRDTKRLPDGAARVVASARTRREEL